MEPLTIGVCTWAIDRGDAIRGLRVAREKLDLSVMQVGCFGRAAINGLDAGALRAAAEDAGVALSAYFIGFDGDDFKSLSTIAGTSGLGHDATGEERLALVRRAAESASQMGVNLLATHVGLVPAETSSNDYARLREGVSRAAEACAECGITLLAETGAEPAESLREFLDRVTSAPTGVNFDPANFVAYGTDDPVRAVSTLAGAIQQVHVKDATAPVDASVKRGALAALGAGDANIPRVISKLRARGYTGPLLLERRAAADNVDPLREDLDYLRSMLE